MAFDGQPVLSTEYQIPQAKVSDGQSVVVTATGNVVAGEFYEIQGFLGAAMTNGKAGDKVVLNIEQAEYSTVQVVDGATFSVGSLVYWNGTAFTNDVGTSNRLVGRCPPRCSPPSYSEGVFICGLAKVLTYSEKWYSI